MRNCRGCHSEYNCCYESNLDIEDVLDDIESYCGGFDNLEVA